MIQGAVETLAEIPAEEPKERTRFEEMIRTHATRMTKIVEDLLNLARVEQEDRVFLTDEVAIAPLVDDCVAAVLDDAPGGESADRVSILVTDDLSWRVHPTLFPLAIRNLVDNAIKYSDAAITIEAGVEAETLVITVADRGPGIPAREIDRVFERFYRVDPGRSRSRGGTGLGLSIVRHVARVHGGTVTVESTPGRGSTFTLHIPGGTS